MTELVQNVLEHHGVLGTKWGVNRSAAKTAKFDAKGYIVEFIIKDTAMAQSAIIGNVLSHHGTKGMRWGVRKDKKKASSSPSESDKTTYTKPVKNLSDADLNKRIKRLELEKKYADLSAAPSKEAGQSITSKVIRTAGEQTSTKLLNDVAYYAGKEIITKMVAKKVGKEAAKEIRKEMFPKKK